MQNYEITLWWNEEDSLFVAEVRDLPGCIAHGGSEAEAIANVNEAARLRIDVAREAGDPVPEFKRQHRNHG